MKRALLLVAIILVPLLPSASALGPETEPWKTYNAVSDVVAIAIAREGTAIAAALGPSTAGAAAPNPALPSPTAPSPCQGQDTSAIPAPTAVGACTDLAILEARTGFARNDTDAAPAPLGRTFVAVSRDGSSIASIGIDGSPSDTGIHVRYLHIAPTANWSGATPAVGDIRIAAGLAPRGLAMSDDGTRIVALFNDTGNYSLQGFTGGSTFASAFEVRAPGAPRALAAAGDMSRVLIAGQFPEGNFSYGGAFLLPFGQGEPLASWFDRSANGTDEAGASISRDGGVVAVGSSDGKVRVFHDAALASPGVLSIGSGAVDRITISEDGTRVAAALGLKLTVADATTPTPTTRWNATVAGQNISGLSLSANGGLITAASAGSGGGVYAYDDVSGTPIWSIQGDTRAVALDAAGTRVAYAQKAAISAASLPRSLFLALDNGNKVAAQRTLALPGNTSYAVTLRNDGAATERVRFESGASEARVSTTPPIIDVRPGTTVPVNVTVSIDTPLSGPRVFNLSARSAGGPVDNVTVAIAPEPTLDVKLAVDQKDVLAQAGQPSTVLLTIANNGTADSAVSIRADQTVSTGTPWPLTISETSLTALRGTHSTVKLTVTPPADVANGTSSAVKLTLEGHDIFDVATVTFRVNPDLKVEINATGVTKFIEPGKRAFYNVTVTNTGSLPRSFEVFYTITESSGRNWGVDMQSQTVRLDPTQKRVITVTIVAPADAQPQEHVSVRVTARSITEQVNETQVLSNVTLYGYAVPLKIPTPTTPQSALPFPGVAPIFAITLVAALLLRRRSR